MIRFLQTPTLFTKILFGAIIFFACVAMVITLIPGGFLGESFGFGGGQAGVLAKVGDEDVTMAEAQQIARRMIQQQFGGRASSASQLLPFFTQRAVQELVMRKALLVEAERMGLTVSDQEVAEFLHKIPQLFPNGQFVGEQAYEAFAQQNGYSVPQLEAAIKNDLLISKLRNVVEGGVTVTDQQVRVAYEKKNTKVKFEYAVVNNDDVMKQIQPTEAELKAFYEKNKNSYANSLPEKRKIQYIYVGQNKLKDKVQVTPDDLKRYYSARQDEFRQPEQIKVRMIAIKSPAPGADGKVDPKALEAARTNAQDVEKQLKSGGNFADLAKKYSQDPDSAAKGGELGWIQHGRFPFPEVDKAVFSLNKGQTSGVIQSPYGFQIFQVEDKQNAHVKTLEEVKGQIEPMVAAQKAADEASKLANAVQTEARATGLANAASKRGLELITSPMVTRTDSLPGIGQDPQFMNYVFSAREKTPPEMAQLQSGYAIYQVTEVAPPATPTFEQARARVDEEFKRERAGTLLQSKLQQLSDRARSEHNLKKAAAEVGATLKTSELVTPEQQVPELGSMSGEASVAFDLKPGGISAPIPTGRGGAVIALLEKQEPSPAGYDQDKGQLREGLLQQRRAEMFGLFVDGVRERMEKDNKIKFNKKEMERLMPKAGEAG